MPLLQDVEMIWPKVIEYVKAKRMSTGIFLSEAQPLEVTERGVMLGLPSEFAFHKETLEKNSNRQVVEEAFEAVAGKKISVSFVITKPEMEEEKLQSVPPAPGSPETGSSKLPEIITQALDIFEGAKIVRKD